MKKNVMIRIWFEKLSQYLLIPIALCIILFPLYGILRQQTIKAQTADAAEHLSTTINTFENDLYDIRFVTNKLFNDPSFSSLSAVGDTEAKSSPVTLNQASHLLEDLMYSMSTISYCYVTFAENQLVIDDCRIFHSYDNFYHSALEYQDISQADWAATLSPQDMTVYPVHQVCLNQTAYPGNFLTISQPYLDIHGRFRGCCTMLLSEKHLINLFLPMEDWRSQALFYIVQNDGTILEQYGCHGPLPEHPEQYNGIQHYDGEEYLFVSAPMEQIDATAVLGLPYDVYGSGLKTVTRTIWFYIAIGLTGCFILSAAMTLLDFRHLRPLLDTIGNIDDPDRHLVQNLMLQAVKSHDQLSTELRTTRNQLEHSRMETLIRTGTAGSPSESQQLLKKLNLTAYNYLLLIPAPQEQQAVTEELWLVLVAEQLYKNYLQHPYIHLTSDGSVLAILTLQEDSEAALIRLCRQTENLHHCLNMHQPLILSARFTDLEQLSSVYWQARNARTYGDSSEKVCYLSNLEWAHTDVPQITELECLSEYLLAGQTELSQNLTQQFFGCDELSLETFQQIFYSVRGVLLTAAKKVNCEDISHLCKYDRRIPMAKLIQNLCEGCFVIGCHVDSLKQSHNTQLHQRIMNWLGENYKNPDLNAAMVADQFHISKKYVSQFIKDQTGKTYNEYVEELRLSNARALLLNSDMSITEIAAECGFCSQNTFYKAFRRRYDLSPSALRHDSKIQ